VAQVFAETCASCHGAKLQGGQAASLLDDVWMRGGDDRIARLVPAAP
jgi:mono/diheme cytochrome c family protein